MASAEDDDDYDDAYLDDLYDLPSDKKSSNAKGRKKGFNSNRFSPIEEDDDEEEEEEEERDRTSTDDYFESKLRDVMVIVDAFKAKRDSKANKAGEAS